MRSDHTILLLLRRHQIILASVLLSLLSLHLALTDKKQTERGAVVRGVLAVVVSPLQNVILGVSNAVGDVWGDYIYLVGVKEENEALKLRVASLEEEKNELTEELALTERLAELLEYKKSVGFDTVAASIQAFNIERWTRTIVINKGSDDGLSKDMSVITPEGVVGRIIEITSGTSRVLLATDLRSDIDVILQRTRIKGIAEGDGADGMILNYIRELDDVRVGDRLVTSGFAGIYPKGLVVGTVVRVRKGKDNFFKDIKVAPSVDTRRIEDVLVVTEAGNGKRLAGRMDRPGS